MTNARMDAGRRFIQRRPLALAAGCYGAGAAVGWATGAPPLLWMAGLAAALCAYFLRRRAAFGFGAMMLVGALLTSGSMILPEVSPREDALIQGRVIYEPIVRETDTVLTLDRVMIDGKPFPDKLRIYVYDPIDARLGDRLVFTGDAWLPARQTNPGGFDFAMWLWKDRVSLCASANAKNVRIERGEAWTLPLMLSHSRKVLGENIDRLFPRQSELVRALVIGDKNKLPNDLYEDFRRAGVAHLLAVSGLHIGCLAMALEWLLRRASAPRWLAYAATLLLTTCYAALVGFPASAVRALLMFGLARGAPLTGRPSDSLTGLSAAFFALVLYKPLYVLDNGFILSFGAVAALMLLTPTLTGVLGFMRIKRKRGVLKTMGNYLFSLLCASLAATLGTLPAVATLYGGVSPWSVLSNLIAVPVTLCALPLSMLATFLGTAAPDVARAVAWLPDLMLDALARVASFAARLPYANAALPSWPAWLCAAFALACVACSPYVGIRAWVRQWMLLALPALILVSLINNALRLPRDFTIAYLDAGQADAAVVHAEGEIYLVDVGDTSGPTSGYLRHYGIGRVKAAFLSHPHKDHMGGLLQLLSQASIETIYLSARWDESDVDEGMREALDAARARGSKIVLLHAGDEIALSKQITAKVLQPGDDALIGNANDGSMVLSIRYGEGSALFLGDLSTGAENLPMPDCDVIKVAHHGAADGTSELLLRTCTPSVAVVSVGHNSFGHPSQRLLDRLDRLGVAAYRTDQYGMIETCIQRDGTVSLSTYQTPEE